MSELALNTKPTKVLKTTSQELVNQLSTELKNTKKELKSLINLSDTFFLFEIDIKKLEITQKRKRLQKLIQIIKYQPSRSDITSSVFSISDFSNDDYLYQHNDFYLISLKLSIIDELIRLSENLLEDYDDVTYNKYLSLSIQLENLLNSNEKYFLYDLIRLPSFEGIKVLESILRKRSKTLRRIRSQFLFKYKLCSLLIIDKRRRFRDIIRLCFKKASDVSDDVNCFITKIKRFLTLNITYNELRRYYKAFG